MSTKYTKRSRIATFGWFVFKLLVIWAIFLEKIRKKYLQGAEIRDLESGSGIREQGTGNREQGSGNKEQESVN